MTAPRSKYLDMDLERRRRLRGDAGRQMQESAKPRATVPRGIGGEGIAGESIQEPRQRDARLQACEIDSGAGVNAESERQVAVRLAPDVQSVGLMELRRIAIGGADAYGDA